MRRKKSGRKKTERKNKGEEGRKRDRKKEEKKEREREEKKGGENQNSLNFICLRASLISILMKCSNICQFRFSDLVFTGKTEDE